MPRFPLTRTLGPLGVTANGAARWYLAGGISASACVAAYQPKGSTSLAASYTNLNSPGTYNAAPGVAPTWAVATWTGSVVTATGSSKKVRVEPTAAQTGALNRGDHPFDVQATLSGGRKVTLVPASTLTVIEDYSA